MPRPTTARTAPESLQKVARLVRHAGLVLRFHRVAPRGPDPLSWCVDPQNFRDHVEALTGLGLVRPLGDLVEDVRQGNSPHGIAITLDLGFADHLDHALPVLSEFGVPATLFMVTGLPGEVPWWEALAADLARIPADVEVLELEINGNRHRFAFDGTPRRQLATLDLRSDLAGLRPRERDPVLSQVRERAGHPEPAGGRFMTDDQVGTLAFQSALDVGAASVTHPSMARIPVALQEQEIRDSVGHLAERLGRPVDLFAYPFGLKFDIDYRSRHLVRESGLVAAFTSQGGPLLKHSDLFTLPRQAVWNGGVDETFTRALPLFR